MQAYANRTAMASYLQTKTRLACWCFLVLGFLLLPGAVTASTPPVQPDLTFTIAPAPGTADGSLVFQVTWTRNDPLNRPPEYILVETFSLAENKRLGTIPVPREGSCSSGQTCTYRKILNAGEFPTGSLSLTATDPLSQATNHKTIAIAASQGIFDPAFLQQFEQERRFYLISAILGALLLCILAVLVRRPTG
jgi:hypothetical protein